MRRLTVLLPLASLAFSCTEPEPTPEPAEVWTPEVSYRTPEGPNARGFLDRRGLIHAHSVFSHDACDNEPILEDGSRDPVCFDDFRRGLCQSEHDFVFLTDHNFDDGPFPEVVLHREERGDELVDHGDGPVANFAGDCSRETLIIGGYEKNLMAVGVEGHVEDMSIYSNREPASLDALHDQGALTILMHTEDEDFDTLTQPGIDGFEMYNLHANLFLNLGEALELALRISERDPEIAHPDLMSLHVISEDPRYVDTWAQVLAAGHRRVTTMGTDCHRNSLPGITEDGERIDSYRRMMRMFSNHLLVEPNADGGWDDRALKAALAAGRLYGSFDIMGFPEGFDFHAAAGAAVVEMGGEVSLADAPELRVAMPKVQHLDPAAPAPEKTARILRATDAGWVEVAAGEGDLSFTPTEPGAYRAEVRMVPHHLTDPLRFDANLLLDGQRDWVWIYANAIYIVD